MPFVELGLPPGLKRAGTIYSSKGRWYEQNFVRWFADAMKPIGGWTARTTSAMTGICRALISWRNNAGARFIGAGTHSKLYALTQTSATPSDITPAGFTPGRADATAGAGYGIGLYGAGTYGTPRIDNVSIVDASMWTLDTDGQDLVGVMSDDGKLYEWLRVTANPAVATTGAPTGNAAVVVTPERFVMLLGANGVSRRVQWADQEDRTTWSPTSTNQAGDYDIQTAGKLLCGKRLRNLTLILSDLDAYVATYIGLPYVYSFVRVGDNCGGVSRGCIAGLDTRAVWMSQGGFFAYDGSVALLPCEVWDELSANVNWTQRSKIVAMTNSAFSEAWWFYPSGSSLENDSYVHVNLQEGHWNLGSIIRTAAIDRGVFGNPIMASATGYLYDHETGASYDGVIPYAESGPVEVGLGDRLGKVRELIPDEATLGQARVSFDVADSPTGAETTFGPYTPASFTEVRFAGRQARMKVEFVSPSGARWGNPRLDVIQGGRR